MMIQASSLTGSSVDSVSFTQVTRTYILMEMVHQDGRLTTNGVVCGIIFEIHDSFGELGLTAPETFVDSLEPVAYEIGLQETSGAAWFELTQIVEIRGWQSEHPMTEALPETAQDPRVYDQDQDGNPGMTMEMDWLWGLDELHVVTRDVYSIEGTVESDSRLSGLLVFESEMYLLQATNDTLLMWNDYINWQDPEGENSKVVFQRIVSSWSCDDILANTVELFD
jgi:hypothetical protein